MTGTAQTVVRAKQTSTQSKYTQSILNLSVVDTTPQCTDVCQDWIFSVLKNRKNGKALRIHHFLMAHPNG